MLVRTIIRQATRCSNVQEATIEKLINAHVRQDIAGLPFTRGAGSTGLSRILFYFGSYILHKRLNSTR